MNNNTWPSRIGLGLLVVASYSECQRLSCAAAQSTTQPSIEDLPVFRPKPGVPYVGLDIPDHISPKDVDRYAADLSLSEDQTRVVHMFYVFYAREDNALRWNAVAPLFERSAKIAVKHDMTSNPATAAEFAKLMMDRGLVEGRLTAGEDSFFEQVDRLLTETQRLRLDSVRLHRLRERCRALPCEYFGGRIDLSDVLFELTRTNDDFVTSPSLRLILDDYELALTRNLVELYKLKLRWVVEENTLVATTSVANSPEQIETYRQRSLQMNRQVARLGRRLHDLNVQTLQTLASAIPDDVFRQLLDAFRRQAYPAAYPDPYDFQPVVEECLRITNLSDAQIAAVKDIAVRLQATSDQVSKRMVDRYLARMDSFLVDRAIRMDEHEAYKKDMTDLQTQRRLNAQNAVREMKALLTEEQNQEIQKADQSFQKAIASHRTRESGLDFRP